MLFTLSLIFCTAAYSQDKHLFIQVRLFDPPFFAYFVDIKDVFSLKPQVLRDSNLTILVIRNIDTTRAMQVTFPELGIVYVMGRGEASCGFLLSVIPKQGGYRIRTLPAEEAREYPIIEREGYVSQGKWTITFKYNLKLGEWEEKIRPYDQKIDGTVKYMPWDLYKPPK
jgi:hypothetical protein